MQKEVCGDHLSETHDASKRPPLRTGINQSSFHQDCFPYRLADDDPRRGSYNAGLKLDFGNGSVWLVRFRRASKVHDGHAGDNLVAMAVALIINLIRHETTIPVPKIEIWGVVAQSFLGLGTFIIMEFIHDGVSLNKLFKDPNDKLAAFGAQKQLQVEQCNRDLSRTKALWYGALICRKLRLKPGRVKEVPPRLGRAVEEIDHLNKHNGEPSTNSGRHKTIPSCSKMLIHTSNTSTIPRSPELVP